MRLLLARCLACAGAVGCAEGHYYDDHGTQGTLATGIAFTGRGVGPAMVWIPPPPEDPDVARYVTDLYSAPVVSLAARVTPPDPEHHPFDATAALAAIHAVDLAPCADRAAEPRGYGHARVTFDPGGAVSRVLIDAPTGLQSEAVACVGEHLGVVAVPPFEGGAVTVGATYYVR